MPYYVVRDTNHPQEDLNRNFSSPVGGFSAEYAKDGQGFKTEKEAQKAADKFFGGDDHGLNFRYHPAYNGFVEVAYDGLGAFELESENLEDAIKEAVGMDKVLACCCESGSGHFFSNEVISFHEVSDGRWIFKLK